MSGTMLGLVHTLSLLQLCKDSILIIPNIRWGNLGTDMLSDLLKSCEWYKKGCNWDTLCLQSLGKNKCTLASPGYQLYSWFAGQFGHTRPPIPRLNSSLLPIWTWDNYLTFFLPLILSQMPWEPPQVPFTVEYGEETGSTEGPAWEE